MTCGRDEARAPGIRFVRMGSPEFTETDNVVARWFAQHGCTAAIVRPDHYVWGVARDEASLGEQLQLLGHQMKQGDRG